jgi:hypothetical protein
VLPDSQERRRYLKLGGKHQQRRNYKESGPSNGGAALIRLGYGQKKGARIKIQPVFKIQYPMKNQYNNKSGILTKQYPKQVFIIVSGVIY